MPDLRETTPAKEIPMYRFAVFTSIRKSIARCLGKLQHTAWVVESVQGNRTP